MNATVNYNATLSRIERGDRLNFYDIFNQISQEDHRSINKSMDFEAIDDILSAEITDWSNRKNDNVENAKEIFKILNFAAKLNFKNEKTRIAYDTKLEQGYESLDIYERLGILYGADEKEIKRAVIEYKRNIINSASDSSSLEKKISELDEWKAILLDPIRRKKYDNSEAFNAEKVSSEELKKKIRLKNEDEQRRNAELEKQANEKKQIEERRTKEIEANTERLKKEQAELNREKNSANAVLAAKRLKALIITGIFAVAVIFAFFYFKGQWDNYQNASVASGTVGTATWSLRRNGELDISGGVIENQEVTDSKGQKWPGFVYIENDPVSGNTMVSKVPWNNNSSDIKTVDITGTLSIKGDSGQGIFAGLSNVTTFNGINNVDCSGATTLSGFFANDSSLTSLSLSSWNTANVKAYVGIFLGDESLTSVDISPFSFTSNNDLSQQMFSGTSNLQTVTIGKNATLPPNSTTGLGANVQIVKN
ncbi:MAG: BspA family leucine-rich repeat surface protein [Lactococcus lactis]